MSSGEESDNGSHLVHESRPGVVGHTFKAAYSIKLTIYQLGDFKLPFSITTEQAITFLAGLGFLFFVQRFLPFSLPSFLWLAVPFGMAWAVERLSPDGKKPIYWFKDLFLYFIQPRAYVRFEPLNIPKAILSGNVIAFRGTSKRKLSLALSSHDLPGTIIFPDSSMEDFNAKIRSSIQLEKMKQGELTALHLKRIDKLTRKRTGTSTIKYRVGAKGKFIRQEIGQGVTTLPQEATYSIEAGQPLTILADAEHVTIMAGVRSTPEAKLRNQAAKTSQTSDAGSNHKTHASSRLAQRI